MEQLLMMFDNYTSYLIKYFFKGSNAYFDSKAGRL